MTDGNTDEQPPFYPFPNDEVLWWRNIDGFDPSSDSYFALGELPESDVRTFNGEKHTNPYRLVVRTPVRGSQAIYTNIGDMVSLFALALTAMAHDDSGAYGPKDENKVVMSERYWSHLLDVDIEVKSDRDSEEPDG